MWKDGRQVLMAALAHSGRCLPSFAVAYQIKKILRSQNQAEHAFFLLLSLLRRSNQQITCINGRGFARISPVKQLRLRQLRFITRVCHNTYFASKPYEGLLRDYAIKEGGLVDLGEGVLGKDSKCFPLLSFRSCACLHFHCCPDTYLPSLPDVGRSGIAPYLLRSQIQSITYTRYCLKQFDRFTHKRVGAIAHLLVDLFLHPPDRCFDFFIAGQ
jgi:hypothetical protein